jgi:hypothetical protein
MKFGIALLFGTELWVHCAILLVYWWVVIGWGFKGWIIF